MYTNGARAARHSNLKNIYILTRDNEHMTVYFLVSIRLTLSMKLKVFLKKWKGDFRFAVAAVARCCPPPPTAARTACCCTPSPPSPPQEENLRACSSCCSLSSEFSARLLLPLPPMLASPAPPPSSSEEESSSSCCSPSSSPDESSPLPRGRRSSACCAVGEQRPSAAAAAFLPAPFDGNLSVDASEMLTSLSLLSPEVHGDLSPASEDKTSVVNEKTAPPAAAVAAVGATTAA